MPKNIVIFSDGTGQAGGLPGIQPSNVYKLFQACPIVPGAQATFYDPGLGCPLDGARRGRWRALYNLASQMTGLGLSENIADCYDALIRLYEPGDRIYLFGFSRGAYTVRSLGGVLSLCGIPTRGARGENPRASRRARRRLVWRAIHRVYQTYGHSGLKRSLRARRAERYRARYASHEAMPYFIGAWDTVRALGLPGVSRFMLWRHAFHDATLNPKVPFARQALALDENRAAMAPVLWDETEADRAASRIKQVWFPGVHSDVGGGYPECELSDLSLEWMVGEATSIPEPLLVDRARLDLRGSHRGMQHDERMGWGVLWRKGVRAGQLQFETCQLDTYIERRFLEPSVPTPRGESPYRPLPLARHPSFTQYYEVITARRGGFRQRLALWPRRRRRWSASSTPSP
jgi:uncharacterized protein (DUF2235 family)